MGEFPTLKNLSLDKIEDAVRNGITPGMPSFAMSEIGPADLLQMFVNLSGDAAPSRDVDLCDVNDVRSDSVDWISDYNEGLAFFRKPDPAGAACANCHGPDGFDLAASGAQTGDIFRRGLLHLPVEDVDKVDRFLAAVRAKHNLPTGMAAPRVMKPFQPGGAKLACGDDLSDCDHAFGLALAKLSPTLAGPPIKTVADAKKAAEELMKENFRTFPIGMDLNPLAMDGHHGREFNSLADWFPDTHRPVKDAAARQAIYAAMDDYLADPTWDELFKMIDVIEANTDNVDEAGVPLNDVISNKYLSIQVYQHILRNELALNRPFATEPETIARSRNYFWRTGDAARVGSDRNVWLDYPITDKFKEKFNVLATGEYAGNPERSLRAELDSIRVSWFFAGMQMDGGLYESEGGATQSTEYFTHSLYQRKMVNHLTWIRFRKNLAMVYGDGDRFKLAERNPEVKTRFATRYGFEFAYMNFYGRGLDNMLPSEPEKQELYFRLAANAFRMNMLLVIDEIRQTGQVYHKAVWENAIFGHWMDGNVEQLLVYQNGGNMSADDAQIIADLKAEVAGACDARSVHNAPDHPDKCQF